MRFHLASAVAEKGLIGAYSLLKDFDISRADPAAVTAYVDKAVAKARNALAKIPGSEDPVLRGFHQLHLDFSVPTRKLHSAPETLLRYLEKRGDIPRIGPFVDLYNAVSIETRLAVGAHDLDHVEGDVSLRLTDGTEHFHPIGAPEPEAVRPGEYAYVDDAGDVICRLEVRQVEKTKVTAGTKSVFLIVQGNARTSPDVVRQGHDRLLSVLSGFFGGTVEPLYRP
ncbi:conserved hypothetical protein [uncultured Pleomorphomonas sp.]|uniref:B3/B4 tRNA-binding domain-containing protein n=1 Tax=uncultured Pleomorphomonas sp. TaxID=442121 RepID=A0A212LF37_9HYPH|nr:phenylalanine--tRNA ligase beta subunit-related protein [uncultured Pleomorphomonas sp.]SCM76090.1 conserved hypothetical protein [uncultured Pleomorphomonas sp.]